MAERDPYQSNSLPAEDARTRPQLVVAGSALMCEASFTFVVPIDESTAQKEINSV